MIDKNKDDSEVLFLSGIYPEEIYEELTDASKNSNVQMAANNLQWGIIYGMEKVLDQSIKLLNVPFIPAYPRKCRIFKVKKIIFHHQKEVDDINFGFWNLPVLRQISVLLKSCLYLKKWAHKNKQGFAISYALTIRNIYRLAYIKKINSNIKTCMIVPDLPVYMRMNKNLIYSFLKMIEIKLIKLYLRKIDAYVLLTEYMNEFVEADNYCVVEGIAEERKVFSREKIKEKIVFYSGTLEEKYGVMILVEAFSKLIGNDYRLYICGNGSCKKKIENAAKKDERIKFLGQISKEKVLEYQNKSTVLVNPRQNIEEFTKYSFPSKNLEYLSSGIPMIGYKLKGIPDEYDDYIIYVENNSVDALKDKLFEVLEYSEEKRKDIGDNARQFVKEQKSAFVQAKKILDMMEMI